MKLKAPILIGGAIAACAGLSLAGVPAPAHAPTPDPHPVAAVATTELSVRERRERFNDRVQAMLEAGKVSRLNETRAPRPTATPRRAVAHPPAPRSETSSPGVQAVPVAAASPPPQARFSAIAAASEPSRTIGAALIRPTNAVDCLTQAIYYEARSESVEGQAAVAEVILNRTRSGRYPREVCDVVYQRNARTCQFSYTCDGSIGRTRINPHSWVRAERIAREVYAGQSKTLLPSRSVNYHANYVAPSWGRRLERVRQIGAHIFYGSALHGGTPGASDTPVAARSSGQLTFVRLDALDRAYDLFREADRSGSESTTAPAVENPTQ